MPCSAINIVWLQKRLDESNDNLDQMIHASPLWQHKAELMLSISGIGRLTSTTFLVVLPEISSLLRREISGLSVTCVQSARMPMSMRLFKHRLSHVGRPALLLSPLS